MSTITAKPFALSLRESEELRAHLAKEHSHDAHGTTDSEAINAHSGYHPEVDGAWSEYGGSGQGLDAATKAHHRELRNLLDQRRKYVQRIEEEARKDRVTAAWKKMTVEDVYAVIAEHGPLTASAVAGQINHLIPDARNDVDTGKVNPKLASLNDAGRITKARFGDLPGNVRRNVNGAYGTADNAWVYGLTEQFVAMADESEAIKAEQARRDEVFATVCSRLAERYEAGEIEGKIGKGRGGETVSIDVDFLAKIVGA